MNATPQNGPMQRKSHLSAALTTSLRSQAAFVRALLDELERISPADSEGALGAQLVEELARLGCRCLETASALSATVPAEVSSPADAGDARCA